ncbi:hypothetical protein HPK19_03170 [Arthrobacter citreus]|nr:hypothetical protein HPK19_03170 [Arthrobacter citreus]
MMTRQKQTNQMEKDANLNVNMRQLIHNFNVKGNREIIDLIMELTNINYLEDETRMKDEGTKKVTYEFTNPLCYIALGIRSMREHASISARSMRADNLEDWKTYKKLLEEMEDALLYGNYWYWTKEIYEKEYFQLDLDDENEGRIFEFFESKKEYDENRRIHKHFTELEVEIEKKADKIRNKINKWVIKCLEHAISNVDITRSDKEIVVYINKAWKTKYIEVQLEGTEEIRHQRIDENGKKYSVIITPKFVEKDKFYELIFNKTLNGVGGWDILKKYLNKNQVKLVEEIMDIINEDYENENFKNYRLNHSSKYVLNKRYMAGRLGMSEGNLKNKITRLQVNLDKAIKERVEVVLEEDKVRKSNKYTDRVEDELRARNC